MASHGLASGRDAALAPGLRPLCCGAKSGTAATSGSSFSAGGHPQAGTQVACSPGGMEGLSPVLSRRSPQQNGGGSLPLLPSRASRSRAADENTRLVVGSHEAALGKGFGQLPHGVLSSRLILGETVAALHPARPVPA